MRGARPDAALAAAVARELGPALDAPLLIGVSGGPDSVALAALAVAAARGRTGEVVLAHVNHGQRIDAGRDEAVALALGTRLGLRVRVSALSPAPRLSEARLRKERYARLVEIAREIGAPAIAVAHQAEDQTETVLLALFRGTGADGLGGMPPRRELEPGIQLLRPLLRFSRGRLIEFCLRSQLPMALDPSNEDRTIRRNAVRAALHELRPLFPGLDQSVARSVAIVGERGDADRLVRTREALRDLLVASGAARDITFERLDAVARALERGRPGSHFLSPRVSLTIGATRSADLSFP
ncbi:MAG TPA: tRNA lysidine(34) synthetase TilS [Candidatus Baltobacteraceae bacterium]|jgi:tRNA(Ile)-lysidine synthase|nr:tRNA lysidine(34) synthetase TilS [Candidatus Baltobacteraceae bacterium]